MQEEAQAAVGSVASKEAPAESLVSCNALLTDLQPGEFFLCDDGLVIHLQAFDFQSVQSLLQTKLMILSLPLLLATLIFQHR